MTTRLLRVRCTVPSVSAGEINGRRFEGDAGGLLSEPMDAEAAAALAEVPGYELVDDAPPAPAAVRDMGLVEAASALHGLPWVHAIAAPAAEPAPEPAPAAPALAADTNGDGRVSAAEKRAAAKRAAAAPAQP